MKPSIVPFLAHSSFLWLSFLLQSTDALQIGQLLSTCVDACQRGCVEIRRVQASRGRNPDDNNKDNNLRVELKDDQDPRSAFTEADSAAQKAIIGSLRAEWGGDILRLVGEEDNNEEVKSSLESMTFEPLKKDMFEDDIGETSEMDPSDVVVFVDPLDGTREFVEGRVENCQVLVGIAVGGEAVGGVIGIPFPDGDLSTDPTIIYGLADVGTGFLGTTLSRGPFPLERNIDGVKYPRPHHATGDSSDPVMEACRKEAIRCFGGSNVIYGGAGNKILAAALGEVACSIQHKVGGAWDLCAPEAILKAMGGKMTDLIGEDIAIYRDGAPVRCNERGYIATPPGNEEFHDNLAAALKALPEVQKYYNEVSSERD